MERKVIVQCGIQIDDEYWYVAGNTNGLFKKNLLTGKLDFLGFFPNEYHLQFRAYTDLKLVDNKIVFTPCSAKEIAVYNLNENTFSKKPLPAYESGMNQYLKSVKYKSSVYFIPFSSSSFIKYDVNQEKIIVLQDWSKVRSKYVKEGISNITIEPVCVDNNFVYMFINGKNQTIILDMDTDQFYIEHLDIPKDEIICAVCESGKDILVVTDKNNIYRWNHENSEIELIIDFNQYIISQDYCTHYMCESGKNIYLINVWNKDIMVFNYIDKVFSIIDMGRYVSDKTDDNVSLYYYYDIQSIENNKISLFSYYDGKYITIEGTQVTKSVSGFRLPEDYFEKIITDKFSSNPVLYEGKTLKGIASCFSEEIKIILFQNTFVKKSENEYKKGFGKFIHRTLTKEEA